MRESNWIQIGPGIDRVKVKEHVEWAGSGEIPLAVLHCRSKP